MNIYMYMYIYVHIYTHLYIYIRGPANRSANAPLFRSVRHWFWSRFGSLKLEPFSRPLMVHCKWDHEELDYSSYTYHKYIYMFRYRYRYYTCSCRDIDTDVICIHIHVYILFKSISYQL